MKKSRKLLPQLRKPLLLQLQHLLLRKPLRPLLRLLLLLPALLRTNIQFDSTKSRSSGRLFFVHISLTYLVWACAKLGSDEKNPDAWSGFFNCAQAWVKRSTQFVQQLLGNAFGCSR